MQNNTVDIIKARLEKLNPVEMQVTDDSALHHGHAGAAESGGGHYTLEIVSSEFESKSMVERHRMIYTALGEVMGSNIHALVIKAKTPGELETTPS